MVNGYSIIRRRELRQIAGPYPGFKRGLDQSGNGAKPDFAINERGHRDFVRGIIDSGGTAAGSQGLVSQPKSGKSLEIRGLESQLSDPREIEARGRPHDSIR